jgi:hypothetical protein
MPDPQEEIEIPVDRQSEILKQLVKTNQLLNEMTRMFGSLNHTISSTLRNIADDTEKMKLSLRKLVKTGPTEVTMNPTGSSPSVTPTPSVNSIADRQAFPE